MGIRPLGRDELSDESGYAPFHRWVSTEKLGYTVFSYLWSGHRSGCYLPPDCAEWQRGEPSLLLGHDLTTRESL